MLWNTSSYRERCNKQYHKANSEDKLNTTATAVPSDRMAKCTTRCHWLRTRQIYPSAMSRHERTYEPLCYNTLFKEATTNNNHDSTPDTQVRIPSCPCGVVARRIRTNCNQTKFGDDWQIWHYRSSHNSYQQQSDQEFNCHTQSYVFNKLVGQRIRDSVHAILNFTLRVIYYNTI